MRTQFSSLDAFSGLPRYGPRLDYELIPATQLSFLSVLSRAP